MAVCGFTDVCGEGKHFYLFKVSRIVAAQIFIAFRSCSVFEQMLKRQIEMYIKLYKYSWWREQGASIFAQTPSSR